MNIATVTALHAASAIALPLEPVVASVLPWTAPTSWRGTSRSMVADRRSTLRNLDTFAALATPLAESWCSAVVEMAQAFSR